MGLNDHITEKICPLTQKPCNDNCAWLRLVARNTVECAVVMIATGQKPM